MIPNIQTGKSFRGAQLYYLHDKRNEGELLRLSESRVAWTETRNTAHDGADEAFAEMIAIARDQEHLKSMSGVRLSGRPCEEPVMTISLSWHPSERPGKQDMIKAGDGYLARMGWDEHQAVYLCHTDTAHPHLHIILNRIHPETGRVLDDAFSKNRSQEWARDYEKEYGRVWCEERVGKDYRRADGKEPNSLPHDFAIDAREVQRGYAEIEEAQNTLDTREKERLAKHHQDEREAFFETRHKQFREARQAAYREVRQEYKPLWVEHFPEADAMRRQAEQDAAQLALAALRHAGQGDFEAAWDAIADRDALRRNADRETGEARRAVRDRQRAETRQRQDEACAALYQQRAETYAAIKLRQKDERAELKELQGTRAAGAPYDKDRLIELVTEPVAERLPDPPSADHAKQADDLAKAPESRTAEHAPELADQSGPAEIVGDLTEQLAATLQAGNVMEEKSTAIELPHREPDASRSTVLTGAADAAAGGIGKLAEILADAIAAIVAPETEKERARRLAAQAKQKPRQEPDTRPEGGGTSFSFDSYFGEHGDRLRREEAEYWRKRREEKDNSNER